MRSLLIVPLVLAAGCLNNNDLLDPPEVPRGVVAVAGNGQVFLSWDPVEGADGYRVYRALDDELDLNDTELPTSEVELRDTDVVNGERHFYAVTAQREGVESELSAVVDALPDIGATAPGAVPNFSAESGPGGVTLSWVPLQGVLNYTLYRSRDSGVTPTDGEALVGVDPPHLDEDMLVGETWHYVLTATTEAGESPWSAEVSGTRGADVGIPDAPVLSAAAGNGAVSLSWTPVAGATSYTLYFAAAAGVTPANGTAVPSTSASFEHTGLTNGVAVFYVVTASNAEGESAASNEVSATPDAGAPAVPPAPAGLVATPGDGAVTLTWTALPGVEGYTVHRAEAAGVTPGAGTAIATSAPTLVDTGLTNGTAYFYVVTARNTAGTSPASAEVSATPTAGGPAPRGTITASLTAGHHAIVLIENLTTGQGFFSTQVLAGAPPNGVGVDGLTVTLSGEAAGPLNAVGGGSYSNNTPALIAPGVYTSTVAGAVSGTVTATLNEVPACAITQPAPGATLPANTDLELLWTSSSSDKVIVKFQDAEGTVTYPGTEDNGGVILPGTDLFVAGPVEILVSAAYQAASATGDLVVFGDCAVNVTLQ
jgi:fibronectin type 3 domain-containing protein